MHDPSRRQFLTSTLGSTTALGAYHAWGADAPNEKVGLAFIGLNGMGGFHLNSVIEGLAELQDKAEVLVLCDVDQELLNRKAELVKLKTGRSPRLVTDFRRVIEDPSVRACVIATPNHWHCPIGLAAIKAGKDIYIEKPMNHVFREGQLMIKAARKYQRIVQHGTQMRSSEITQKAGEVLASGVIGEVKMTKAWNSQRATVPPARSDEPVPAGVDYDMWLGPAPAPPFNRSRFHQVWRWYREYGNGDCGDDGIHDLDMARWALNVNDFPVRITSHGSNVDQHGERQFPDNMTTAFRYANGKVLLYEERSWTPYKMHEIDTGNAFYGTEGYMIFTRRGFFQVYLGRNDEKGPGMGDKRGRVGNAAPKHLASFVDSVSTRQATSATAEIAHHSTALVHLGEIAARLGEVLNFDPATERFTNNEQANTFLSKEYRSPWELNDTV